MSYTKGPWEIEKFVCLMDRSDVAHWRKNGKPNAQVGDELWWVARSIGPVSVSNNHWAGDYLDLSPEDICLIAAAPDLLEALKIVMSNNEWLTGETAARAAIAKAEGK
jgi:hypothetical protein